ncbi:concanavalin A-like lectin/glucanase domain-containing protein [Pilobolus umbonatus]|nr:concanavalin A-like lectin/glucanase domain-containing protein [Pilobolus umbonatus]
MALTVSAHDTPVRPRVDHVAQNTGYSMSNSDRPMCHNYRTTFISNMRGWQVENNFPYNLHGGRGPTLNSTTYIKFGTVSARLRVASEGGVVTAFILIADDGDEIDFEFIGGDTDHVQTNYFWGQHMEYMVNGGIHNVSGSTDKEFHKYTIVWQPDKIQWLVDDKLVRTKLKSDTCNTAGVCKFPTQPARIQIGLWDGSYQPGIAAWSHGPIDWRAHEVLSAYVKDVTVDCNPAYNQIVS